MTNSHSLNVSIGNFCFFRWPLFSCFLMVWAAKPQNFTDHCFNISSKLKQKAKRHYNQYYREGCFRAKKTIHKQMVNGVLCWAPKRTSSPPLPTLIPCPAGSSIQLATGLLLSAQRFPFISKDLRRPQMLSKDIWAKDT